MKSVGPLKIRSAQLCDDIRREINNKISLIGVMAGDVLVPEFPAHVGLAIYAEMEGPAGQYTLELRLSGPGPQKGILNSYIDHQRDGIISLATQRIDLFAEKPGRFKVDCRLPGGKWINLITKSFLLADLPTA